MKKIIITSSLSLLAILFIPFTSVFAVYGGGAYTPLYPHMEVMNFVSTALRMLLWWIVSGVSWIVDGISTGLYELIQLPYSFFESSWINGILSQVNKIYFLLLAPTLIFIGYKLWIKSDQNHEYTKKILRNIVVTICLLSGFSWLMGVANDLMSASVDSLIESNSGNLTLSQELIRSSIIDIEYVANQISNGASYDSLSHKNNLTSDAFQYFDINTKADKSIFDHALVYKNNSLEKVKLSDGVLFTSFGEEFLYRYQVQNWLALILQLLVMAIAYVFSGVKFARLIFDLGFKKVIATGVAILDIDGSGKFKKLLSEIGNTFVLMFLVVLLFVIYTKYSSWINDTNTNIYVQILLQIGGALALIDGPKIVEKLTGKDAGLSTDAMRAMAFGASTLKSTKGLIDSASNVVRNVGGYATGKLSDKKATDIMQDYYTSNRDKDNNELSSKKPKNDNDLSFSTSVDSSKPMNVMDQNHKSVNPVDLEQTKQQSQVDDKPNESLKTTEVDNKSEVDNSLLDNSSNEEQTEQNFNEPVKRDIDENELSEPIEEYQTYSTDLDNYQDSTYHSGYVNENDIDEGGNELPFNSIPTPLMNESLSFSTGTNSTNVNPVANEPVERSTMPQQTFESPNVNPVANEPIERATMPQQTFESPNVNPVANEPVERSTMPQQTFESPNVNPVANEPIERSTMPQQTFESPNVNLVANEPIERSTMPQQTFESPNVNPVANEPIERATMPQQTFESLNVNPVANEPVERSTMPQTMFESTRVVQQNPIPVVQDVQPFKQSENQKQQKGKFSKSNRKSSKNKKRKE